MNNKEIILHDNITELENIYNSNPKSFTMEDVMFAISHKSINCLSFILKDIYFDVYIFHQLINEPENANIKCFEIIYREYVYDKLCVYSSKEFRTSPDKEYRGQEFLEYLIKKKSNEFFVVAYNIIKQYNKDNKNKWKPDLINIYLHMLCVTSIKVDNIELFNILICETKEEENIHYKEYTGYYLCEAALHDSRKVFKELLNINNTYKLKYSIHNTIENEDEQYIYNYVKDCLELGDEYIFFSLYDLCVQEKYIKCLEIILTEYPELRNEFIESDLIDIIRNKKRVNKTNSFLRNILLNYFKEEVNMNTLDETDEIQRFLTMCIQYINEVEKILIENTPITNSVIKCVIKEYL